MNSKVAWVLGSLGTQVKPQIILDPNYLSRLTFRFFWLWLHKKEEAISDKRNETEVLLQRCFRLKFFSSFHVRYAHIKH